MNKIKLFVGRYFKCLLCHKKKIEKTETTNSLMNTEVINIGLIRKLEYFCLCV